jgi:hypothetical protein
MFDLKQLHHTDFEALVGLLLKRDGYQIVRGPSPPGTRGPDFEAISPAGLRSLSM